MRVTSNLQWPENLFDRSDRFFGASERFVAALDVEWTKDYQIKNGSRPFCYSLVTQEGDEAALIASLDSDLQAWLASDSVLTGHQLSSDLSVVKNASTSTLVGIEGAYELWRTRRSEDGRVFDTRYDVDHLPVGASRRLVDVCGDVKLDVRQPELARGSMTKLQRDFLEHGTESIREQLLTLNVRHSLSTALVACLGMGLVSAGARNVNQLVHQEMWDIVEYVRGDHFERLLG